MFPINMVRIICPDKLNNDPTSQAAEKEFPFRPKTSRNFIEKCGDRAANTLSNSIRIRIHFRRR